MREEGPEAAVPLRKGWTTGTCATASPAAAWQALLSGAFPDLETIALPRGGTAVEVLLFDRAGELIGRSGFDV